MQRRLGSAIALVGLAGMSLAPAQLPKAPTEGPAPQQGAGPAIRARLGTACPSTPISFASVSDDGGASFAPRQPQPGYHLAWGLAATDVPERLLMHADSGFWISHDDGCTWFRFADSDGVLLSIATGPGGWAYAWPVNGNGASVYALFPLDKAPLGYVAVGSAAPPGDLVGFGVDASDAQRVRAIDGNGQIYDSINGGRTWRAIGVPAEQGSAIGYVGAFDPQDLDHAVFGQSTAGGAVTFDGGQTWTPVTGLSTGRANFFNAVISPVDGATVYGAALDLEENLAGHPSGGRHIYVSNDGGQTFTPVLDHNADGVLLQNQPLMLADPVHADVVHFVFSVQPLFGGTRFYAYNQLSDGLTIAFNGTIPPVRSMAFSGAQRGRLIAGFEVLP